MIHRLIFGEINDSLLVGDDEGDDEMEAEEFGAFIAKCRKEKNMTQSDLAIKLQVTDKAISRWERGVGFPDINNLEPLAEALGVSVPELMKSEKEDDMEAENEKAKEWTPRPIVMVGIIIGLVVFVVIFCVIVWKVTHKNTYVDTRINGSEQMQDEVAENVTNDEPENVTNDESENVTNDESENVTNDEPENVTNDEPENVMNEEASNGGETPEGGRRPDEVPVDENANGENTIQQDPDAGTVGMSFTEVADMVTAKDVVNLRTEPSTLDDENIMAQLLNGQAIARTGVNDNTGWSRLDYNGQVVYAVSNYLTTDLSYKPPVEPSDPNRIITQDGRIIIFTDIDDYVTPKMYVNLRTEPSTSQGEATARCQISNGTVVHRTGYSEDYGWSRVEYNGEVLYVVSSMINTTEVTE